MLRRCDNFESLRAVDRLHLPDDRDFRLQSEHQCAQKNKSTGMSGVSAERAGMGTDYAGGDIERRRGLAFERQQVDVFLNARRD